MMPRSSGVIQLRYADRQSPARLTQLPPRYTRNAAAEGPVGSIASSLEYERNQSWHHSHTLPFTGRRRAKYGTRLLDVRAEPLEGIQTVLRSVQVGDDCRAPDGTEN